MASRNSFDAELARFEKEGLAGLNELIEQARNTIGDVEAFSGDNAEATRERLAELLSQASSALSQGSQRAAAFGRETLAHAQGQIERNPWRSIAIASGVGLLVGLVLGRGGHH